MVTITGADVVLLPARSVALAVRLWAPSVRSVDGENAHVPALTVAEPSRVAPSNTWTLAPASTVPFRVGRRLAVVALAVVIATTGAVLSTVMAMELAAPARLPATSVAVPAAKVTEPLQDAIPGSLSAEQLVKINAGVECVRVLVESHGNSLKRMSRVSPLRGCDAPSVAERSTLDHASAMSPFYLGRRLILFAGHKKYPSVALDRAGITVSETSLSLQPARQVNAVVRRAAYT